MSKERARRFGMTRPARALLPPTQVMNPPPRLHRLRGRPRHSTCPPRPHPTRQRRHWNRRCTLAKRNPNVVQVEWDQEGNAP